MLDKTARNSERFLQQADGKERASYGIVHDRYIQPKQITHQINQKVRAEKDQEVELWEQLLAKAEFDMPGASKARLNALVYK